MGRVWVRLEQTARAFLRAHGLALSISGRAYLSLLCFRAARVIAAEGSSNAPDVLALADRQLELLLATAAGISVSSEEGHSDLHSGPPRGRGLITADDLRNALRQLGSIWPFVKHGRK